MHDLGKLESGHQPDECIFQEIAALTCFDLNEPQAAESSLMN